VGIPAHAAVYAALFLGAVFLTRWRPAFGLALLIVVVPISFAYPMAHTTITLPKVALFGVIAGLAGSRHFVVLRERRAALLFLAALAIAAVTALSYTQATFKEPALRETLKALEYLLTFAAAAACYRADPDERVIRCVVFGVAAAVSLFALRQEWGGATSAIVIRDHVVARIAGPLEGPNQLSGYLGLLLPVMIAFALRGRAGALGWICIAVSIVALVLTFSRAGVLCAIVAVAIVFAYDRRRENVRAGYAVGALLLAAGSAALLIAGELSRFWSTESTLGPNGLGTRSELWRAAWYLWQRHPWLGIGAGNYEFELGYAGYPELHTHANSGYLQTLVEQGVLGLPPLLWLTWLSLSFFITSRLREPLVAGILGAMAGMALHEVFDDLLFYPKAGLMFWLLLGVGASVVSAANNNPRRAPVYV